MVIFLLRNKQSSNGKWRNVLYDVTSTQSVLGATIDYLEGRKGKSNKKKGYCQKIEQTL